MTFPFHSRDWLIFNTISIGFLSMSGTVNIIAGAGVATVESIERVSVAGVHAIERGFDTVDSVAKTTSTLVSTLSYFSLVFSIVFLIVFLVIILALGRN